MWESEGECDCVSVCGAHKERALQVKTQNMPLCRTAATAYQEHTKANNWLEREGE